jgi:hypothetical protein
VAGSFATAFAPGWFTQSVDIEPWLGSFDEYGNPIRGLATPMTCYIDERVRMIRDFQGNERASTTTVYLLGGPVDAHDRITMPGSFKGHSQPPIIWVRNVNDRNEFSHSEVYL